MTLSSSSTQPVIQSMPNGLTIASDHIISAESIAICILVKTGARHERENQNGLSHFLEHMAFKGTKTRSAKDIAEEFDAIGGQFNAYTSYEETVYYARVLKKDWKIAVDILSDIIRNSVYSLEEIDREKGVILQEIAQYQDMPDSVVSDIFQELCYPNQPLGRTILGKSDFISSVTREQLIEYVEDRYHAQNMIISAAGNINHKEFTDYTYERLTSLPSTGNTFMKQSEYRGGYSNNFKELEQVNLCIGFKGASCTDPNFYTQRLASLILGGGMSSRLFQEVREKRGLAYHISSFPQSYLDSGVFTIFAGTSPQDTNNLLDVTLDQLNFLGEKIDEIEMNRAKTQIEASILMSKESVSARAEKLASNIAVFGRYITSDEVVRKVESISGEDIKNFIKNMLNKQNGDVTIASLGNIANMYNYDIILSKLNR